MMDTSESLAKVLNLRKARREEGRRPRFVSACPTSKVAQATLEVGSRAASGYSEAPFGLGGMLCSFCQEDMAKVPGT